MIKPNLGMVELAIRKIPGIGTREASFYDNSDATGGYRGLLDPNRETILTTIGVTPK